MHRLRMDLAFIHLDLHLRTVRLDHLGAIPAVTNRADDESCAVLCWDELRQNGIVDASVVFGGTPTPLDEQVPVSRMVVLRKAW